MKFRGTKADLERWIDWVDDNLRHVPHGQTVRSGDGPERRLTVREMFTHVLDHLDRLGPDAVVRGDLLPFEEYWRQTMLSCFPPDKRYDSEYVKRRLQKKGAHLIVLPAVSVPVLCASGMHFKVETAVGVDDHCAVKVSIPPSIYRRKKVLGQMTRYREDGRIIFCYGSPAVVHSFIQGQRGGDAPDVPDILPALRCRCPRPATRNGRALRIPGLLCAGRPHAGRKKVKPFGARFRRARTR